MEVCDFDSIRMWKWHSLHLYTPLLYFTTPLHSTAQRYSTPVTSLRLTLLHYTRPDLLHLPVLVLTEKEGQGQLKSRKIASSRLRSRSTTTFDKQVNHFKNFLKPYDGISLTQDEFSYGLNLAWTKHFLKKKKDFFFNEIRLKLTSKWQNSWNFYKKLENKNFRGHFQKVLSHDFS